MALNKGHHIMGRSYNSHPKAQDTLGKIPEGFKVTKCPPDPRITAAKDGNQFCHRLTTIILPGHFDQLLKTDNIYRQLSNDLKHNYIWDKVAMTMRSFIWLSMRHPDGIFFVSDVFYQNNVFGDMLTKEELQAGRKFIEDWLVYKKLITRHNIKIKLGGNRSSIHYQVNLKRVFGIDSLPDTEDTQNLKTLLSKANQATIAVFLTKAKHIVGPGVVWYFTDPWLAKHMSNLYKVSAMKKRERKLMKEYKQSISDIDNELQILDSLDPSDSSFLDENPVYTEPGTQTLEVLTHTWLKDKDQAPGK